MEFVCISFPSNSDGQYDQFKCDDIVPESTEVLFARLMLRFLGTIKTNQLKILHEYVLVRFPAGLRS